MTSNTTTSASNATSLIFLAIALVIILFYLAAAWSIFRTAGQPGWACIIPIYNTIALLHICGRLWPSVVVVSAASHSGCEPRHQHLRDV